MKTKRALFFSLGVILVGIGAVGVALPVLPTTPFIIAAAACFGKSSKRAEKWLSNNRYFGSYIENYKNKLGVPIDVKRNSLIIVGIGVSTHILLLKTKIEETSG